MTADQEGATGYMARRLDPEVEQLVRESFGKQGLMRHLGASMTDVRSGEVRIRMPFKPELTPDDLPAGRLCRTGAGPRAGSRRPADADLPQRAGHANQRLKRPLPGGSGVNPPAASVVLINVDLAPVYASRSSR
jgi:hypothetical protein